MVVADGNIAGTGVGEDGDPGTSFIIWEFPKIGDPNIVP